MHLRTAAYNGLSVRGHRRSTGGPPAEAGQSRRSRKHFRPGYGIDGCQTRRRSQYAFDSNQNAPGARLICRLLIQSGRRVHPTPTYDPALRQRQGDDSGMRPELMRRGGLSKEKARGWSTPGPPFPHDQPARRKPAPAQMRAHPCAKGSINDSVLSPDHDVA